MERLSASLARELREDEAVLIVEYSRRGEDGGVLRRSLGRRGVRWQQALFARIEGASPAPLEEADLELGIRVEVLRPGHKVEVSSEEPWSGQGPFRFDETRRVAYRVDRPLGDDGFDAGERRPAESLSLAQLEEGLRATRDTGRAVRVRIDARSGCVYSDIVALIDALARGGVTDVLFVGAYAKR